MHRAQRPPKVPIPVGWRLDAEGCHLGALEWHVQVDEHSGDQGAERLEVVPTIDENHPRIHQHPYGEANDVRLPANLSEPVGWLSALNALLRGVLDDGLREWDSVGDKEFTDYEEDEEEEVD